MASLTLLLSLSAQGGGWPLFPEALAVEALPTPAPYLQGVMLLFVGTLLTLALLYLLRPSFATHLFLTNLQLMPGDMLHSWQRSALRFPLGVLGVLGGWVLAILLESIYASLVAPVATTVAYWQRVGLIYVGLMGYAALSWLLYRWMWSLFVAPDTQRMWWSSYYTLLILWGVSLLLPLAMLLWSPLPEYWVWGTLGAEYILFRIVLIVRSAQIFRGVFFRPLHLFLYLCSREIAPLLFAWSYWRP